MSASAFLSNVNGSWHWKRARLQWALGLVLSRIGQAIARIGCELMHGALV